MLSFPILSRLSKLIIIIEISSYMDFGLYELPSKKPEWFMTSILVTTVHRKDSAESVATFVGALLLGTA